MEHAKDTLLSIHDLVVEYTSGKKVIHAVNGISLEINEGETLALVGETSAGKTTIAKTILNILPDPPSRVVNGEVLFHGEDILKMPIEKLLHIRGEKIAMIFQDPMTALNPVITVGQQIATCFLLHGTKSRVEATKKAEEMLELVGIPAARYGAYPFEFSGGMKQRVVIAMALACNPELLLADEPTTALDVTIQAQVLDLINDLKVRQNTAMLLITHDLGVVAQTCDRVAVIYAGTIVEQGDKRSIFKNPQHPYTIGLFQSLPNMNDNAARLTPINGLPPDPSNLPKGCPFAPRCREATRACFGEIPVVEFEPGHLCRCINRKRED